ncbi:MAG: pectinesterase family protein [Tannerellaceae bacterium]|nr:pectinesterase family protein [Tannerellaceae bacterium]
MKNKFIFLYFTFVLNLQLPFTGSATEYKRITVAADHTGNYSTVQEAINNVRSFDPDGPTIIFIRNGVYKEKVEVYSHQTNILLIGESRDSTIITFDNHANMNNMGTFRTYTLIVRGNDIVLENLTIENNAEPLGQAVAFHQEGDRIIVRNCRFLGNQDTIYTGKEGGRCYFENCYIEGTTDFIFGPSTCWFEKCNIYGKVNSYITAASTPSNIRYGYIFNDCKIELAETATNVYLGRPWRAYAMTLFMNCYLPEGINPVGWHNWNDPENEKTARYLEYNNNGPGASTAQRVDWSGQLTSEQVYSCTIENVMKGCDGWNPLLQSFIEF